MSVHSIARPCSLSFFLPVCDLDVVILWLEAVVLSAVVEVVLIRSPSAISLLFIQDGILGGLS